MLAQRLTAAEHDLEACLTALRTSRQEASQALRTNKYLMEWKLKAQVMLNKLKKGQEGGVGEDEKVGGRDKK